MKFDLLRTTALAPFLGIGVGRPTAAKADKIKKTEPEKDPPEKSAEDDDTEAKAPAEASEDDAEELDDEEDEGEDRLDREDMKKTSTSGPRRRERARVAAILAHPSAKTNTVLALHLALNTDMPRGQACAALDAAPPAAEGLSERMKSMAGRSAGPGTAQQPTNSASIASGWGAAFAKVNHGRG